MFRLSRSVINLCLLFLLSFSFSSGKPVAYGQLALSAPLPVVEAAAVASNVSPLPNSCTGTLPPGGQESTCCISGLVYMDGEIVAGAEVEITSASG